MEGPMIKDRVIWNVRVELSVIRAEPSTCQAIYGPSCPVTHTRVSLESVTSYCSIATELQNTGIRVVKRQRYSPGGNNHLIATKVIAVQKLVKIKGQGQILWYNVN